MNRLLTVSATELARMIREKDVTSLEAVETHIRRIESVNKTLNAMIRDRFDTAREEARAADKKLRSGKRGKLPPFFGVPCTIKECFSFTGMPNTSGLYFRKDVVGSEDATGVARIRAAGAIPLGVTNVPELCMWMETDNRVWGRTNNPYDARRIVGGSSGGEGSIIGAGGSPFGLGSDIGGSIRMPAFFNGIFGHKPTGGLVPGSGQYPIATTVPALRYLTTGPLARRAEDLWPLLNILRGPDGKDAGCTQWELGDPKTADFAGLRVLNVEDNGAVAVSRDLRAAQRRCVSALKTRGARIINAQFADMADSFWIWGAMIAASGGPSYEDLLGQGQPVPAWTEIAKLAAGSSQYTLPSLVLVLLERMQKSTPGRAQKMAAKGSELREEVVRMIGDNGVMLFPSYSSPAPMHHAPLLRPFNFVYTAIINVMELPSTQVPLGLNSEGVPLGVQVVSKHGNDHLCVAVAMELEKAFGGWVPPEKLGTWD